MHVKIARWRGAAAVLVAACLSACTAPASHGADPAVRSGTLSVGGAPRLVLPPDTVVVAQPGNVGDAKIAAAAYHDSAAYGRGLATVDAAATQWIDARARTARRPALVLDVDETALSNWEVLKANDFGRFTAGPCLVPDGPCGFAAWDLSARAVAIAPTLALFRDARSRGVTVFFITGRPESQRAATADNLRAVGYVGYRHLYMVPDGRAYASAADFKTPVRAAIARAGFDIIANIGDQPSDLAGGQAERSFLLPDPFYRVP